MTCHPWRFALGMTAVLLFITACAKPPQPMVYPPVVVMADYKLTGAVVRGAERGWWKDAVHRVRYDDPLPVRISMYCLKGTTRRGRYVRAGIVAADPRYFPLAGEIELYVGREYLGRFQVDDTGKRIRGERIDVWTSSCREANRFGLRRGIAVLARRAPAPQLAGAGR